MIHKKNFSSFEEVDKELKILKLKKEIDYWKAKNSLEVLKYSSKPKNIAASVAKDVVGVTTKFMPLPKNIFVKTFAPILLKMIRRRKLR